jgi:hypothetical protein
LVGVDVAATVHSVPTRYRKLVEVDVAALEDPLFDRTGGKLDRLYARGKVVLRGSIID